MKRCALRPEASAMALGIFDGHEAKMLAVEAGVVVAEVLRMCWATCQHVIMIDNVYVYILYMYMYMYVYM